MAKFYGAVGYAVTVETSPSVWEDQITERMYSGELIRNYTRSESSGGVNDNINVSNNVSIIADPYANDNLQNMRYVKFRGTRWKIVSVEDQYPRLTLILGGVYNG